MRRCLLVSVFLVLACRQGGVSDIPGDSSDSRPYAGIASDETLHFTGTEPFWGGEVSGGTLAWATPERPDGIDIPVERFGGRGGLSFSGTLGGASLDLMVTPGDCSDGMSDRTYPFAVTVRLGQETLKGCAWSARQPFRGPQAP